MNRLIEIRSYRLKPGSGARFHDLVVTKSIPLLHACGMEVVAFGRSLHDPDAYFLMRAYDDLERLRAERDAFYASDAWRQGPRQAIIELIEADANAVIWLSAEAVEAIRGSRCSLQR